jgi:hypothetical protein
MPASLMDVRFSPANVSLPTVVMLIGSFCGSAGSF